VRVPGDGENAGAFVRGGNSGTEVLTALDAPAEVTIEGDEAAILGAMSGRLDIREAAKEGRLRLRGRASIAGLFPALFHAD
jgi:hypothetical protein